MAISGTPTVGIDTITVTPTGFHTVDGLGGEDTLRVDYSTLTTDIDHRYVINNYYTFTDDFFSGVTYIGFERFILTFGSGDDRLSGGNLADSLLAGAGNDTIASGLGADTIDGGTGLDRWEANYGSIGTNVAVTLLAVGTSVVAATGARLTSIEEAVITTGAGADTLDARQLTGNHSFTSGDGNDTFRVSTGYSTYNAGAGTDLLLVNYSAATTRVQQVYTLNGWNKIADAANTRSVDYYSVERFDITTGSGNDILTGSGLADRLVGNAGRDWLNGGDGADTINGGDGVDTWQGNNAGRTVTAAVNLNTQATNTGVILAGIEAMHYTGGLAGDRITAHAGKFNDTVYGGAGNDTITSGRGRDVIDAGADVDTLIMDWSAISDPTHKIMQRYVLNGWNQFYSASGDRLDYYGVERFNLTAGAGNDYLLGGASLDTLVGNDGNDTLNSGLGLVTVDGGAGDDLWVGNLSDVLYPVIVDAAASQTTAQMTLRGSSIRNIERMNVTTGEGADSLSTYGYALDDTMTTGIGNDTINPGLGHDTVNGEGGTDTLVLDYSTMTSPVSTAYTLNGWNRYGTDDGATSVDYYSIEQFNVTGGSGHDVLSGGSLRDTLVGGAGDDILNSGQGTAVINGGTGNDRWEADLSAFAVGMTFNAVGSQTTPQLTVRGFSVANVESVAITGSTANDSISTQGFALDDTMNGAAGNDTLAPGLGFDVVQGGDGIDVLQLNYSSLSGAVSSRYTLNGWNRYETEDESSAVDYYSIERFNVTGSTRNDVLTGAGLNDTLSGGLGNDTLNGGTGGADVINGGSGLDTWSMDLSAATTALSLTISATGGGTLVGNGTTLVGIENVQLNTGTGNDTVNLAASNGNHVIRTGSGNDLIDLGRGRYHTVDGGGGIDTLIVDGSNASGGLEMAYVLNGWHEIRAAGGSFDVDFYGIETFDITGSNRNDRLWGFGNADTLNGGAGSDILEGAGGNDILTGGLGVDQFLFNAPATAGVDLITDATAGDFLRIAGAALAGNVTLGNGSTLGAGAVNLQVVGGVSTLFVGLNATVGYDFRVDLTGAFTVGDFTLSGTDILIV